MALSKFVINLRTEQRFQNLAYFNIVLLTVIRKPQYPAVPYGFETNGKAYLKPTGRLTLNRR